MRKYNIIYIIAGILLFATSCTLNRKIVPMSSISTQVSLTMGDLEYIGEVQGNATQYRVLCLPYGGRRYHSGVATIQFSSIQVPSYLLQSRGMDNAMYDALQQKPDADFILPVSVETKKHVMFLGSKTIYNVKAKAFKIRTK